MLTFDPASWNDRRPQWSVALEWKRDWSSVQLVWLWERPRLLCRAASSIFCKGASKALRSSCSPHRRERIGRAELRASLAYRAGARGALAVLLPRQLRPARPRRLGFRFRPHQPLPLRPPSGAGVDGEAKLGPAPAFGPRRGWSNPRNAPGIWSISVGTARRSGLFVTISRSLKRRPGNMPQGSPFACLGWSGSGCFTGIIRRVPLRPSPDAFGPYSRQFFGPMSSYLTGRFALGAVAWPIRFRSEALWELGGVPGALILLPRLEARLGRRVELQAGARLFWLPSGPPRNSAFFAPTTRSSPLSQWGFRP